MGWISKYIGGKVREQMTDLRGQAHADVTNGYIEQAKRHGSFTIARPDGDDHVEGIHMKYFRARHGQNLKQINGK